MEVNSREVTSREVGWLPHLVAALVLFSPALSVAAAPPSDAQALFDQGVAFDYNGANRPDPARAFTYYKKAAAAGSTKGAFNVGVMYDAGQGVAHDPAAAATWYAIAAAMLEPRGAYNLGELYASGDGVPKNPALAAAWFRRAAGEGVAAAATRLRHLPLDTSTAPTLRATPPPATAAAPPEAASLTPTPGGTILVWTAQEWPYPVTFYVEVAAIDAGHVHDVFTGMTDVSAVRVTLPPGSYAWRVLSIDPQSAHYTANTWTRFALTPAA